MFILTTEVLFRNLNALFGAGKYHEYGLPKRSREINHLAYADDTIIFTSTDRYYLEKVMKVLKEYQQLSRKLINGHKSSFYIYKKVVNKLQNEVK